MVPNKRQCWLESFGSHPQRPPRLAGRTAAFATPPCSRQEAARWPPEPQPAADPWENLQAERKRLNILILKFMTSIQEKESGQRNFCGGGVVYIAS